MIKNYLTVSFRNLAKNKFYLFINVAGLGLALATCIVAYLSTQFGLDFDSHHVNADKIYKVQIRKSADQGMIEYGFLPMPLGPRAMGDIGDIKMQARYTNDGYTFQKDDIVLTKHTAFADESFFDMFTFPMKLGDPSALKNRKNVILSSQTAEVYFGDKDPVGEIITLRNDDNKEFPFIVGGVLEELPLNSSHYFDVLLHFDNYHDVTGIERGRWQSFVGTTYFYIETPAQASTVEKLLENYITIQNEAKDDWKIAQYYLLPLPEFGPTSQNLFGNWINSGMHPAQLVAPPVMAFLILLIACFNFTNTSIAISSKRLKEIGIRKVMGGGKKQLIIQFMSENLMVCFAAIVVGMAIANYLVPAYSAMWPNMSLDNNIFANPKIYLFTFSLLIVTAILAGAYPSLYVSSFEPVKILRETIKIGGTSRFSKVLLSAQYLFTVMALFAGVAFIQNARYQETLDLGYNRDTIIGAQIDNHSEYLKLKDALRANPAIEQLAGSSEHIGRWDYSRTLRSENQERETFMLDFGVGYVETMGLEVVEGRAFSADLEQSDIQNSLMVNERLVKEFGWTEPIGKRVAVDDSTTLTVIGVVKDFYFSGFWRDIDAYGMRLSPEEDFNFLVARVPLTEMNESFNFLEEKWREVIPDKPFDGFYQNELGVIRQAKEVNSNIVVIFGFLSVISVILSGIGLFTLVSLNIIKRIKEIGVRKVLGAPVHNIVTIMNKPFAKLIVIGGISGLTIGYFIVDMLIKSIFANSRPLDYTTFLIPLSLILLVSMATSSFRILGAARRNPVDSLRYE